MSTIRRTAVVFVLLSSVLAALPAAALDGCPRGEFTLDSCVLCLPGYSPQPTGAVNPAGKPCYACLPDRKDGDLAVVGEPTEPILCGEEVPHEPVAPADLASFLAALPRS